MTIACEPATPTCAPWCNDHQLGRNYEHCNRLVAQLEGSAHEYVEITKAGDDTRVFWSRADSDDAAYIRSLGRALLEAADTMDQVGVRASDA